MTTLQEAINNSINSVNEAKINYWMLVDVDEGETYLVTASTLEEAKELVESVNNGDIKSIFGWLINDLTKINSSKIVYDSTMIKSKGDKKY